MTQITSADSLVANKCCSNCLARPTNHVPLSMYLRQGIIVTYMNHHSPDCSLCERQMTYRFCLQLTIIYIANINSVFFPFSHMCVFPSLTEIALRRPIYTHFSQQFCIILIELSHLEKLKVIPPKILFMLVQQSLTVLGKHVKLQAIHNFNHFKYNHARLF